MYRALSGSAVHSPIDGSGKNSHFIAGNDAIRWHRYALVSCIHRDRLCDPACGSGTFLFQAIRRIVQSAEAEDWEPRRILSHVQRHVFGLDIHPADLYRELDSFKYSRPAPPEVRTMKPAPGPQSPGNWLYVACWLEQSTLLREVAFNALGDTGVHIRDDETGPIDLCTKLAFHAQGPDPLLVDT